MRTSWTLSWMWTHIACGTKLPLPVFDLWAELLQQGFLHTPNGRRLTTGLQGQLLRHIGHRLRQDKCQHLQKQNRFRNQNVYTFGLTRDLFSFDKLPGLFSDYKRSGKHSKIVAGLIPTWFKAKIYKKWQTLRVCMSSTRTTNSSLSLKIPSPPLSLSSSSLSPTIAASSCFWARCREVIFGAGGSSGEVADSGEGVGDSFWDAGGGGGGGGEAGGGVAGWGRLAGGGGDGDEEATGLWGSEFFSWSTAGGIGEEIGRGGSGEWEGEDEDTGDWGSEGGWGVVSAGEGSWSGSRRRKKKQMWSD